MYYIRCVLVYIVGWYIIILSLWNLMEHGIWVEVLTLDISDAVILSYISDAVILSWNFSGCFDIGFQMLSYWHWIFWMMLTFKLFGLHIIIIINKSQTLKTCSLFHFSKDYNFRKFIMWQSFTRYRFEEIKDKDVLFCCKQLNRTSQLLNSMYMCEGCTCVQD